MKKSAVYVSYTLATIVLSLVFAFLAVANPQQIHGLQLPIGWVTPDSVNSIHASGVDKRICDISSPDPSGIPFAFLRPAHNDPTGCLDETNYIAIVLNILCYVGVGTALVYILLIRPLKHTKLS